MSDNEDQKALREHLLFLLEGEGAHAGFDAVVNDFPYELQGKRPNGVPHSPWQLLEHMRIAQEDILEFTKDPEWKSPDFPSGYWPPSPEPPDRAAWEVSVGRFHADHKAVCELVSSDVFETIAHGTGQTILREILLVADHNAYHLGQLMMLRKMLE